MIRRSDRRSSIAAAVVACRVLVLDPLGAAADEPPSHADADDPSVVGARAEFREGARLVAKGQWSEALAAFERSTALRSHPVTTYNMGVCLRALGQYVRARRTFTAALDQGRALGGRELSEELTEQTHAFTEEIDRLAVRVSVRLSPKSASITVDGRPIEPAVDDAGRAVSLVGTLPHGRGAAAPGEAFELLMDPGAHVFTLSRKGFADAVVNRTYAPGARAQLELSLERLPATLRIAANQPGAVVSVNGLDVGTAPVDVLRPGGTHHVVVRKPGFVAYETRANVEPGQQLAIRGTLRAEHPEWYERWWVWAGGGALIAGAVVTTYALTRDERRQEPNRGTLGWSLDLR